MKATYNPFISGHSPRISNGNPVGHGKTLFRNHWSFRFCGFLSLSAVALFGLPSAKATTYYWDLNGNAANTGTSATGSWSNGTSLWDPSVTGGGPGSVTGSAASSNVNDLVFDTYAAGTGSGYTAGGTVTLSANRVASSIAFQGNGDMIVTGNT